MAKPIPHWHRKPNETEACFHKFTLYLNQPTPRHLPTAAVAAGCSYDLIKRYSAAWKWKARACAYDMHNAAVEQGAKDKAIGTSAATWAQRRDSNNESVYKLAMRMRERGQAMLDFPLSTTEVKEKYPDGRVKTTVVNAAPWSLSTANSLMRASVEISMICIDAALAGEDTFDAGSATLEECQEYIAKDQAKRAAIRESVAKGGPA